MGPEDGAPAQCNPEESIPHLPTFAMASEQEKKKMTPDEQAESLDFLRSHGVEVETPEDRVR